MSSFPTRRSSDLMPGKPEAFALAAETSSVSARLAISNTLIRRADGRWRAEHHDVHGIAASLGDHGVHAPVTGAVRGPGAPALSAVAARRSGERGAGGARRWRGRAS